MAEILLRHPTTTTTNGNIVLYILLLVSHVAANNTNTLLHCTRDTVISGARNFQNVDVRGECLFIFLIDSCDSFPVVADTSMYVLTNGQQKSAMARLLENSGSVVECLTRDRGAAGSSLTSITALCP